MKFDPEVPIVLSLELLSALREELPAFTTTDEVVGQTPDEVLGTCNGAIAGTWMRFVDAGLLDAAELGLRRAKQLGTSLEEDELLLRVLCTVQNQRALLERHLAKTPEDVKNALLADAAHTLEQIALNAPFTNGVNARATAARLREHLAKKEAP